MKTTLLLAASIFAAGCVSPEPGHSKTAPALTKQTFTMAAQPGAFHFDSRRTAIIVVDMQNDFGSKGGMMDRAGEDISAIQKIVQPIRKTLDAARKAGIPIVYLKMGYDSNLSDLGPEGSRNRINSDYLHVGQTIRAPDGREGRILVRDTWNTDIVDELKPHAGDLVLYKTRFSGFYKTKLDAVLRQRGIKKLIVTGCTTSVCVESTIRDAMFRDYSPVLLSDCTAEPVGHELPRTNHEASLLLIQSRFGSVSTSGDFIKALETPKP